MNCLTNTNSRHEFGAIVQPCRRRDRCATKEFTAAAHARGVRSSRPADPAVAGPAESPRGGGAPATSPWFDAAPQHADGLRRAPAAALT